MIRTRVERIAAVDTVSYKAVAGAVVIQENDIVLPELWQSDLQDKPQDRLWCDMIHHHEMRSRDLQKSQIYTETYTTVSWGSDGVKETDGGYLPIRW